ncbi:MAG: hypothetical protein PVH88_22385 [Ignavibacteria bacterium]|jgi:hypothetical protein
MINKIVFSLLVFNSIAFSQNQPKFSFVSSSNNYYSVEEYFPFNTQTHYTFESNFGEIDSFLECAGDEIKATYESSGIFYQQSYISKPDGIYVTNTKNEILFFGNDVKFSEPVLRFPRNLHKGLNWEWEGFEVVNNEDTVSLSVRGNVVGTETIITELGEFNCLKIESTFTEYGNKTNYLTEWLAPNVGIVKAQAILKGDGFTAMLQEFLGFDELFFEVIEINPK